MAVGRWPLAVGRWPLRLLLYSSSFCFLSLKFRNAPQTLQHQNSRAPHQGSVGANDDCALGSLTASGAAFITVDGCTLSPDAADVSGAKIQVNRGATLDGSAITGGLAISNLTVDCSIGGGSIANFRPAQNGVLNLTGIVGEQPGRYVASETISSVVDGANLASWRVAVDGDIVRGSSVSIENGNLVAHLTSGFIIIVR